MKQDTEKLHKKIRDLRIQLSLLNGKISQQKTQLQAKEDLIIALRAKEKELIDRNVELYNLLGEHCPEVLKRKQVEWRQKSSVVGVLRT